MSHQPASEKSVIGIIGGSGVYDIAALQDKQWRKIDSSFGDPSDECLFGHLDGQPMVFLPRHGRGHKIPPSAINYRANIDVLKRCGVTDIVALSAIGSLRAELAPGQMVAVDQFIDRTVSRPASFFGPGLVGHVSLADPVCPRLSAALANAVEGEGGTVHRGGTYVAIEGPQFSTRAESRLYRQWGGDVIGMTGMPEARLAREAELPYALLGMVTDYDAWRGDEAGVEAGDVLAVMHANVELAGKVLRRFLAALPPRREPSPFDRALDQAIMTARAARDPVLVAKLGAVAGRVLG